MILDHEAIAARIPHAGSMCLLESVDRWDEGRIECRATSHRDMHNPLRHDGKLSALTAIEYGAQAMALHASLLGARDANPAQEPAEGRPMSLARAAGEGGTIGGADGGVRERPPVPGTKVASANAAAVSPGYLVAVRDAEFFVDRLDTLADDLMVSAERLHADTQAFQYTFAVRAGEVEVARGRLTARIGPLAAHAT